METKEQKVIKKAINGNKKAFEILIKQHYEQIYRTSFLYVHNETDALDVVQEATYQAFISIHTLKNPEYFMTWFTRIVIRCAGQILKKRNQVVPITDEQLENESLAEKSNQDNSLQLIEAVGQLQENYRTAIILFYYHDYSIKTISSIMEIPEGTVKTYLSRGKATLKKYFNGEEKSHGKAGI
ncbi:sigma-70 family RNA polymerase sigma factor [Neobacillus niacini]|uniref:sigma-70 family RNA polymerase sigma factor n=1 Tax=Neobacillus niacini TaxID=86668 RepID=UPI002858C47F|nr:sigma-70 family RNA polymerase sigma factor [Neobacillus niacini]MDR6999037.1 RNA polymerase sigma-70 factor (ECF subfamily) [Neobacillus niacini]